MRNALQQTDHLRDQLRISQSVAIRLCGSPTKPTAELEQKQSGQFFSVGYREYYFLSLFFGGSTFHQAAARMAQEKGKEAFSADTAQSLLSWAIQNKILETCDPPRECAQPDSRQQTPWRSQRDSKLSRLLWFKIPFGNPAPLLEALAEPIKPLARPVSLLAFIALFFLSGWMLAFRWQEFQAASNELLWPRNWWVLAVGWLLLKVIHEFGHGITSHLCGAKTKDCGLIFLLFSPLAYIDVSPAWRISSRAKRVLIGAAGMLAEWTCAAIAIMLWAYLGHGWWMHQVVSLIWLATISTLLFNANPLMRFDGYFMLSDALGKPNLYSEAQQAANAQLEWLFYGVQRTTQVKPSLWLLSYGYLCMVWRFAVCVGLMITASAFAGGLGIAVSIVAIAAWWGQPILRHLKNWMQYLRSRPERAVRCSFLISSCFIAALACWLWIPNPFRVRAACLVQFGQETAVRAPEDGLVLEVLVQSGDQVEIGQPILRLENFELTAEIASLRAELAQQDLAERAALHRFRSGDAEVARRRQAALRETLAQRESQAEALQVLAPRRGEIVARKLDQLLGTTVLQGAVLLNIVQDQDKELYVVVDADEFAFYQQSSASEEYSSNDIHFRIGSREFSLARITSIDANAKTEVEHRELTTGFGGKIPIRSTSQKESRSALQNEASSLRYLQPQIHMTAKLTSTDSSTMLAGETGYATLNSPHPTIGKFLFCSLQDWLQEKIQLAWASEA